MRILEEKGSVMLFLGNEFSLFIRRPDSNLWRRYAGKVIEQEDGVFLLEADAPGPIFNLRLRELKGGCLYSLRIGRDYYILSPKKESLIRRILIFFKI